MCINDNTRFTQRKSVEEQCFSEGAERRTKARIVFTALRWMTYFLVFLIE